MTNPLYDDARNITKPKHAMLGPYDSPGEHQAHMHHRPDSGGWVLSTGNYAPNERPSN